MQKSTIINFCDSWIRRLESLTDIDFQKRVWFRLEGPEVSTFEEETGNIIQKYLDQTSDIRTAALLAIYVPEDVHQECPYVQEWIEG